MILTVTANPALDITYAVPALTPGTVHRVGGVLTRAGGKGVNTARVLRALGEEVVATGFSGGPGGRWLAGQLHREGITPAFVEVLPDLRRTIVVREGSGRTTSLWEPGRAPPDPVAAGAALLARVGELLPRARALVVSGSLPDGVDAELPARLAGLAAGRGVPAVLDVDGDALRCAAGAAHAVIMPNAEELALLTGSLPHDPVDVVEPARGVLAGGPVPAVVATLGPVGIVAVWAGGAVAAAPPEQLPGNPTGAGDAALAAVARALADAGGYDRVDWAAAVVDAVLTSAASVLRPVAGEVDLQARERWSGTVNPTWLDGPGCHC